MAKGNSTTQYALYFLHLLHLSICSFHTYPVFPSIRPEGSPIAPPAQSDAARDPARQRILRQYLAYEPRSEHISLGTMSNASSQQRFQELTANVDNLVSIFEAHHTTDGGATNDASNADETVQQGANGDGSADTNEGGPQ